VLVQSRRDKRAAKRLLSKLLKHQCRAPRIMIASKREAMPGVEHRQHKGLNNQAENSHQLTRRRERQMKRFKSPRWARRFPCAHDQIAPIKDPERGGPKYSELLAYQSYVRLVAG